MRLSKIIKTQNGMHKDAKDEETWITINGSHVLVGEDGNLQGSLGRKIESHTSQNGSQGTKSKNMSNNTSTNKKGAEKGKSESKKGAVNTHNPNRNYGSFSVSYAPKGSTLEKYVKNGKLTPEREALHRQIIDSLLDGIPKPTGQPKTTFLGGGPASGKSSVTRDPNIETPDELKTVCLDSDRIKKLIPEYNEAISKGSSNAANMAHAESSMIAWKALQIAQDEGYDCMMDGTGDGSVEDMLQSIKDAKAAGHQVVGVYVTCDTDTAVMRAEKRAASGGSDKGRKVPESIIRTVHQKVSMILPQIAAEFDEVTLYSTDYGNKPQLIAKGGDGKKLSVVDEELFASFMQKKTESLPYHLANPKEYDIRNT